jgi:hypothetical protein
MDEPLVYHNVAAGGFWGHFLAECSSDPHLEQVWDFRSFFTLAPPRISASSASTRSLVLICSFILAG